MFWATLLKGRQQQIAIPAGAEQIVVQAVPAITRINRGIRDDHIRFSKLMKLGEERLSEVVGDVEVGPTDDDEEAPE